MVCHLYHPFLLDCSLLAARLTDCQRRNHRLTALFPLPIRFSAKPMNVAVPSRQCSKATSSLIGCPFIRNRSAQACPPYGCFLLEAHTFTPASAKKLTISSRDISSGICLTSFLDCSLAATLSDDCSGNTSFAARLHLHADYHFKVN